MIFSIAIVGQLSLSADVQQYSESRSSMSAARPVTSPNRAVGGKVFRLGRQL